MKGVAPWADKIQEIWEAENWGEDEWAEQALAEIAFAKAMNVQHVPDHNKIHGHVAGYRVRRAPNGLVLVPSDSDEDISDGGENESTGLRSGLVTRFGGEASTILSEESLGHSPRGLARYGRAPRQGTAPGNASI